MTERIFANCAPLLWGAGYSAIPCQEQGKAPAITDQYSYADNIPSATRQAEWLRNFPDNNIAVVLSTKFPDGTILGALDVDDDRYSGFVGAVIGYCPVIKKSPRGLTYFVRLPADSKKTAIKGLDGKGAIDVLAKKSLVIIAPSIHPNGDAYECVGDKRLWECSYEELPYVE